MGKTIGDMMEEFRIKAGAREYKGHEFLDLNRFADDTRHMIIFDVVSNNCPWGDKGDRMRLYLNEIGYGKALEFQKEGQVYGIGCKIFTIAGPVILYGIFTSWVLGVIYWITTMF